MRQQLNDLNRRRREADDEDGEGEDCDGHAPSVEGHVKGACPAGVCFRIGAAV